MNLFKMLVSAWIILALFLLSCAPEKEEEKVTQQHIQPIATTGDLDFSTGQMVYVPAYSQIHSVYSSREGSLINFAVTLSIRNTDFDQPIIIKSVTYYDNDGTLLKEYVETPFQLSPMASVSFNISQDDESGGIGANFIVKWGAEQSVHEAYIEAIMIGAFGTTGFAWRSPGHVIKEIAD